MGDTDFIKVAPAGLLPLKGTRVILERCAPEHTDFLRRCLQDNAFMELYNLSRFRGETEANMVMRLAKETSQAPEQLGRIEWVVKRLDDNRELGLTALANYQQKHKRAEFMVGFPDVDDRIAGFALEATLLVLDFAFNTFEVNKLFSYVYSHNQSSQDNTIGLGFKQEGYMREHLFTEKYGFVDMYQNGFLESEFRNSKRISRISKKLLKRDITVKPEKGKLVEKEELNDLKQKMLDNLGL